MQLPTTQPTHRDIAWYAEECADLKKQLAAEIEAKRKHLHIACEEINHLKIRAELYDRENAALRDSHAAIYFALQTHEADHTKWPEQITSLRAAAVEVCAVARVWATVWHDKLSLDSIRRFAELEQQILKRGVAAKDAAREGKQ